MLLWNRSESILLTLALVSLAAEMDFQRFCSVGWVVRPIDFLESRDRSWSFFEGIGCVLFFMFFLCGEFFRSSSWCGLLFDLFAFF